MDNDCINIDDLMMLSSHMFMMFIIHVLNIKYNREQDRCIIVAIRLVFDEFSKTKPYIF